MYIIIVFYLSRAYFIKCVVQFLPESPKDRMSWDKANDDQKHVKAPHMTALTLPLPTILIMDFPKPCLNGVHLLPEQPQILEHTNNLTANCFPES